MRARGGSRAVARFLVRARAGDLGLWPVFSLVHLLFRSLGSPARSLARSYAWSENTHYSECSLAWFNYSFACSFARSFVCLVQLLVCLLVRSLVRLFGLVRPLRIINTKINKVHLPVYNVHLRSSNTKTNMKYLLLGNSNASRASDLFITKDHALKKERRFVKCTSAMAFKLQVTKVRKKNCQMS